MTKKTSDVVTKLRARRQLKNINPTKVSIVDAGANLEPDFTLVKRDENSITIAKGANMGEGEHVVKLGDKELVLIGKKELEALITETIQKSVAAGIEEGLRKIESSKKVKPLINVACGAMVKQKREDLKLSKADVAGRLGISEQDLTAIEEGENVGLTEPLTKALAATIRVDEKELAGLLVSKSDKDDANTTSGTADEKAAAKDIEEEILAGMTNLKPEARNAALEGLFSGAFAE